MISLNQSVSTDIDDIVLDQYIKEIATPEERQTGLNNMIKLALESAILL